MSHNLSFEKCFPRRCKSGHIERASIPDDESGDIEARADVFRAQEVTSGDDGRPTSTRRSPAASPYFSERIPDVQHDRYGQ